MLKKMHGVSEELGRVIEEATTSLGYKLVRVMLSGGKQSARLQIMAEPVDRPIMTVGDCEAISRHLSPILEVADPIAGAYTLEVSSPGLDRPLTQTEELADYIGYEVKLELEQPLDGRKRFRGLLQGLQDGYVLIEDEGSTYQLPIDQLKEGKLVLTDALLEEAAAS